MCTIIYFLNYQMILSFIICCLRFAALIAASLLGLTDACWVWSVSSFILSIILFNSCCGKLLLMAASLILFFQFFQWLVMDFSPLGLLKRELLISQVFEFQFHRIEVIETTCCGPILSFNDCLSMLSVLGLN